MRLAHFPIVHPRAVWEQEVKLLKINAILPIIRLRFMRTQGPENGKSGRDHGQEAEHAQPQHFQDVGNDHEHCTRHSAPNPRPPRLVHRPPRLPRREAAHKEDHDPQGPHASPHDDKGKLDRVQPLDAKVKDFREHLSGEGCPSVHCSAVDAHPCEAHDGGHEGGVGDASHAVLTSVSHGLIDYLVIHKCIVFGTKI